MRSRLGIPIVPDSRSRDEPRTCARDDPRNNVNTIRKSLIYVDSRQLSSAPVQKDVYRAAETAAGSREPTTPSRLSWRTAFQPGSRPTMSLRSFLLGTVPRGRYFFRVRLLRHNFLEFRTVSLTLCSVNFWSRDSWYNCLELSTPPLIFCSGDFQSRFFCKFR